MNTRNEGVNEWRRHTKEKIVQAMGGSCQICSYSKCNDALDLHHLVPKEKSITLGQMMANPKKWDTIAKELQKCILLCANCHRGYHASVVKLPKNYQKFDENLIDCKKRQKVYNSCPMCGILKPKKLITCSSTCAGKRSWKVDWNRIDLPELVKTMPVTQIASKLGVSDVAVHKRLAKLSKLSGLKL